MQPVKNCRTDGIPEPCAHRTTLCCDSPSDSQFEASINVDATRKEPLPIDFDHVNSVTTQRQVVMGYGLWANNLSLPTRGSELLKLLALSEQATKRHRLRTAPRHSDSSAWQRPSP